MMNEAKKDKINEMTNPAFYDTEIHPQHRELAGRRIFVRTGHINQSAPGCVYGGIQEVDINLLNAKDLIPLLQKAGAKVVGTKEKMSVTEMAYFANSKNVDMILDLHCNASEKLTPNGVLCFYCINSTKGKFLGDLIQQGIINRTGTNKGYNQGVKHTMVYKTHAVANIIEYGFLSNDTDRSNLLNPNWRHLANLGILDAVIKYFKEVIWFIGKKN